MVLDERIKKEADKIYASNPQKFKRLVVWIKAAERTYEPAVIAGALQKFSRYAASIDGNWWPFLDKILDAEEGKHNARDAEQESNQHKTELGDLADSLLGRIRSRSKADRASSD